MYFHLQFRMGNQPGINKHNHPKTVNHNHPKTVNLNNNNHAANINHKFDSCIGSGPPLKECSHGLTHHKISRLVCLCLFGININNSQSKSFHAQFWLIYFWDTVYWFFNKNCVQRCWLPTIGGNLHSRNLLNNIKSRVYLCKMLGNWKISWVKCTKLFLHVLIFNKICVPRC